MSDAELRKRFSPPPILPGCGITKGSYYAEFGCLEMEPVKGKPQVFVIGGNGSGIPVYRRLQRMGIPFAAGILHENDVDYPPLPGRWPPR